MIEELDKSLFDWVDPETNERVLEYPLDALHWGGRIVGELEIDFVRVSHQKDSFDKLDPQWSEVVERIRGKPPFRPQIARRLGYQTNTSPLGRLFSGYRSGYAGLEHLVPGNSKGQGRNDSALLEWVQHFHDGEPEYQDDTKWYELVLIGDQAKRGGSSGSRGAAGKLPGAGSAGKTEPETANQSTTRTEPVGQNGPSDPAPVQANVFETDIELSGTHKLESLPASPSMTVNAKRAVGGLDGRPIVFDTPSSGTVEFRYDPNHSFFEESLDTPLDCLVSDLAYRFLLLSGQPQKDWPHATVEREIRRVYFQDTLTSVTNVVDQAKAVIDDLREFLDENLHQRAPIAPELVDEHTLGLIRKGVLEAALGDEHDVQAAISEGAFIRYVSTEFLVTTPRHWPELILDGHFVAVPYVDVSASHQADSIAMVCDALRDTAWVVSEAGGGAFSKDQWWRLRFARALSSIRLLENWRK